MTPHVARWDRWGRQVLCDERHGIWSAKQLMTVVSPTYAPGYPDPGTGDVRTIRVPAESSEPRPKVASNPTRPQQRTGELPPRGE